MAGRRFVYATVVAASLGALTPRPARAQSTVTYNFGTGTATPTHTGGTYTNVSEGSGFSIGNSNGTVTTPINTSSASSGYTGASGSDNLGNAVKTGAFSNGTSSYFTLTLTPTSGSSLSLSELDFGARSTSTGPTSYALYSSLDNYTTAIFVDAVANNSTWTLKTNAFTLNDTAGAALTLRLYTYGGSGSAASGTVNSRIDDVSLTYTTGTASSGGGGGTTPNQYFDLNGATAGSGVTSGGTYTFSGTHFNNAADGTGTAAAFTNDGTATATFSAGTDAANATYTVNLDTAVSTKGIAIEEGNVTLAHATGGSLTLTGASVNVGTGATAIISEVIGGTVGLSKDGAGTLTLSGANAYTGSTLVDTGVLSVASDANLGASTAGVTLNGGTLQTTASFATARTFTGTGSLDIAPGTILASTGTFNTSGLTLVDTGTLDLQGATPAVGNLVFNAAGTTLTSTTGSTLTIGSLTTAAGTGTSTISTFIDTGTTTHAISVAAGTTLALTSSLSDSGNFSKTTGTGTLALDADNSNYTGTITLGGTTASGGTISINNGNALGASTISQTTGLPSTNLNFDTGTLSNDSGGAISINKGVSIGATTTGSGAVLAGGDMTFTLYESLYKGASGTTSQQSLVVNNHTTFAGVFGTSTGTGTSTGLTVSGTGTLTLAAANTFTEALTVSGATVEAASTSGPALAANTAFTVNNGGTLLLSTANQVNTAAPVTLSTGTISIATGADQGSGATVRNGAATGGTNAVGFGALALTANSTLRYLGTSGTAAFTSFDPTGGGTGTFTLNVIGSNFGTATASTDDVNDRLIFNQDISAAGFLGDITFNGVADASEIALGNGFYEIVPVAVPEPATVLGGLLAAGTLVWTQRRRLRGLLPGA